MYRIVVAAVMVVAGALVPATTASATASAAQPATARGPRDSIGVRLLDAPVDRRNDPRARLYIVDHVRPGTNIHRRIEVSNTTPDQTAVAVYPAAVSIAGGVFTVADAHTPDELSTWTTVDRGRLSLAPGARQAVTVSIKVPSYASAGERYTVVWAEVSSAPASGGGVTAVNRVGVRIYLSVGPGGEPPSRFAVDTLTAERTAAGLPVVKALVHNTGGRALDMSGTLTLTHGPGGLQAGPFPAQLGTTLAVHDTETVAIPLDAGVPDGPWQARMRLRSGLITHDVRATLTFPHRTGAAAPVRAAPVAAAPVAAQGGLPAWAPAVAGASGLLLLMLLALFLLGRRRTRQRERARRQAVALAES